jgi:hypothetical protein
MYLPPNELGDLIEDYKKDSTKLREQIADICYFMGGGADWNSAWGMSFEDREIVIKVINKRLKEANPNAKDYF